MMDFDTFCSTHQFSDDTIKVLKDNDVSSVELLAELTDDEMKEIKISLGQRKAILKAVRDQQKADQKLELDKKISNIHLDNVAENITGVRQSNSIPSITSETISGSGEYHEDLGACASVASFNDSQQPNPSFLATPYPTRQSGFSTQSYAQSPGVTSERNFQRPGSQQSTGVQDSYYSQTSGDYSGYQYAETATLNPGLDVGGQQWTHAADPYGNYGAQFGRQQHSTHSGKYGVLGKAFSRMKNAIFGYATRNPSTTLEPIESVGDVEIQQLKLKEEWKDPTHCIRKLVSGKVNDSATNRTILLVGKTGTGKTTLIDGFANYLFGVSWEDKYRIKTVSLSPEEKTSFLKGKAMSQTKYITIYYFAADPVTSARESFTIIDTPGFADTGGIEKDKELVKRIGSFFNNPGKYQVDSIHGVCFVVNATTSRLTAQEKYVFDGILSMFGKDIAKNIFVMATFADAGKLVVRDCLKKAEVPFEDIFRFNNSALFPEPSSDHDDSESDVNEMFWKIGSKNYRKFMDALKKVEPKSLTLSADVLRKREKLMLLLQNLREEIESSCQNEQNLRIQTDALQQHKSAKAENMNFEVVVQAVEKRQEKVANGIFTTNCSRCHLDCHPNCAYPNNEDKAKCIAMNKDGFCEKCEGKCKWDVHYNLGWIMVNKTIKKKLCYDDMKKRYEDATHKAAKTQDMIKFFEIEIKKAEKKVDDTIKAAQACIVKLRTIALKQDPLNDADYIDTLIEEEKLNKKLGFQGRVEVLLRHRKEANMVSFVATGDIDSVKRSVRQQKFYYS